MPSSGRSAKSIGSLTAIRTALLATLIVLTSPGCRGLSRIGDCQQLVSVVNEGVREIQKVAPKKGTLGSPEEYRALGPLFVGLARKLEALELGDEALRAIAKASAQRFRDSARYAGQFSYGLIKKAEGKASKGKGKVAGKGQLSRLRTRMRKIEKKQREAAKKVRGLCRPKK